MKKFASATLAAVVLALSPASAKPPVSKAEIAAALSESGYSVRDFRADKLAVSAGDHVVLVAVDGSDGDITYLTYLTGVTLSQVGHPFLSKFNSDVKFGRAYVDRDGDIAIQMDRNSSGGVSIENIKSDFDVFMLLVGRFLSELDARASA